VFRWVRQDRVDGGELVGVSTAENAARTADLKLSHYPKIAGALNRDTMR
jgi:hypothetical protein